MESRLDTVDLSMPVSVPEGGAEVSTIKWSERCVNEPDLARSVIETLQNDLAEANKKIERIQPMLLKAASFIDGWNTYYKIYYSMDQYLPYYYDILKFTDQLREEAK